MPVEYARHVFLIKPLADDVDAQAASGTQSSGADLARAALRQRQESDARTGTLVAAVPPAPASSPRA